MARRRGALALLVAVLALSAAPGSAADDEQVWPVERVSVSWEGKQALGWSDSPSVSADGRIVAFQSAAPNLVPDVTNGENDIYVRDLAAGTIERVSVASDGTEADGSSADARVSADARFVAFVSDAGNLAAGVTNGRPDIFVHDRDTGETERVSVATDGTESDDFSVGPAISGDGRYVVFHSRSYRLHPDKSHGGWDVFLRDREAGTTELLSRASDGTPSNDHALNSDISADGRRVVFHSPALALDPTSTNGVVDIFLLDMETRQLERISRGNDGRSSNWNSGWPRISADGSTVVYRSQATNLVPETRNPNWDIFAYDVESGRTERVSVSSTGAEPSGQVTTHSVSGDGRYVAYQTSAPNLAPGIGNSRVDAFVHDRVTRATERVSYTSAGAEPDHNSVQPVLSADGRTVVITSYARNMVPDKTNMTSDVYVHARGPALGVDRVRVTRDERTATLSGRVMFGGQVLAAVAATPTQDELIRRVGGELVGTQLVARSHQDDLLFRLELEHLAGFRIDDVAGAAYCGLLGCPNSIGGGPLVLYGLAFELDGVPHEARAQRPWTEGSPFVTAPRFELHRCDDGCAKIADLQGATGTTGDEILLSLPLGEFGLEPGAALTGLRAYAAVGHIDDGAGQVLSEADLPDTVVPGHELRIALPGGQQVTAELLPRRRFRAELDAATLPPAPAEVRLEACVGDTCAISEVSG